MAQINFYLRDKNAVAKTMIMLSITWNGNRLRFSTGLTISPLAWNWKKSEPSLGANHPENELLIRKLRQLEQHYFKMFFDLEYYLQRLPTKDEFIDKARPEENSGFGQERKTKIASFNAFLYKDVETMQNQLKANGKSSEKYSVASSYMQTFKLLLEFNNNKHLSFADINQQFYGKFLSYCTNVKKYKPNNIGKHIRNIKASMNRALKMNLHKNRDFQTFSKPVENVDTIYLNMDEILKIWQLTFSEEDANLEQSRDLFIIACWTGLRYSDWYQFSKLDLRGDVVTLTATKTGKPVVIPLHPMVRAIVEKYNYILPKPKHNVVVNRDLKVIGKLAGLFEISHFTETIGGNRQLKSVPKYKRITCHTARRSFATNLYNMGISAIDIMQITGHRTETTFMKYIRISRQEAAMRILSKFASEHETALV